MHERYSWPQSHDLFLAHVNRQFLCRETQIEREWDGVSDGGGGWHGFKKKVITLPSGWFEIHLFFMSASSAPGSAQQAPLELKLFRWSASARRSTWGWSCTVFDRKWKWGELFIHLLKYLHTICFCHSVQFEQCGCCWNLFSNRKWHNLFLLTPMLMSKTQPQRYD